MSAPVTKLYYLTSSLFNTTYGGLRDGVAPAQTNTAIGWNVGQNNPPLYCEMNWPAEVARTSTQWQATPTQSIPNQTVGTSNGNCILGGPINGEFTAGNWIISMSVKAVTNAATHTGRLLYRVWTSPTGSGASASLITASFISSSIVTVNSTTNPAVTTCQFSLPRMNLKNEFLLFQTYWEIVTAAANNNADNDFVLGTGSFIQSSPFIESSAKTVLWKQYDD
jgi:hypothetical protein